MHTSLFDLFRIGIGPSSSHTVGPMRAAGRFAALLARDGLLARTAAARVELYGSLALTGRGHGTDRGVLLGLMGESPETVDPARIDAVLAQVGATGRLRLAGTQSIDFRPAEHIDWRMREQLPAHPNALRLKALAADGAPLAERTYYSVGGGFIREEGEHGGPARPAPPLPFGSSATLLRLCAEHGLRVDELVLRNELAWRPRDAVRSGIAALWQAMRACVDRGLHTEGTLPGGLQVARRAPALARRLARQDPADALGGIEWLNACAMAVNEENAAGGRVVTAPTNGAAGILPAVAWYHERIGRLDADAIERYFLAAAAIGILYKENASISGAEVGCQGEVGVACSMAAGGLVAALGGDNGQVEHAAEIAMEHNLGMTCDPVGGLVQIPCIERNAIGAVKAVNAARMAMASDGQHKVTLDQVISTMYRTGLDMQSKYKETALGGLAVHVVKC